MRNIRNKTDDRPIYATKILTIFYLIAKAVIKSENMVRYFAADLRKDRITVGGNELSVGSFAMLLLEEGYKDDTLLHITPFIMNGERVMDDLNADCVDSNTIVKTGEDIRIMLNALRNLSPYRWFDIDGEIRKVTELFTADTAEQIEKYFTEKAKLSVCSRAEVYIRNKLRLSSSPEAMPGRALLDSVKEIIGFYLTLADDLAKADYSLRQFMRELPHLGKADEHNLLLLALDRFRIPDFDVHTEYISAEDKKGKKTLARRLYFTSYYSFLMTDFFEGIRCGHYPRRCHSNRRLEYGLRQVFHYGEREKAEIL